jgi:hypothetical protein
MRTTMKTLFTALVVVLTAVGARANVLFSDNLNYPNGSIEGAGLWFAYAPATPHLDAYVNNHLLILNQNNYDAVAAPSTNFVNNTSGTLLYSSFTINVSQLPSYNGGYLCIFKDNTNDYVSHVFIDTRDTIVPGTYRLGIANFGTSITTAGAANFPLDLATNVTYQVVMSYDPNFNDPLAGATLWINPASETDVNVYGTDSTSYTNLLNITISQIGFSQYANQGVAAIGNVKVGTVFSDVDAAIPQLPVFGIQPQSANVYSNNSVTLYAVASGIDVTYQWLSNNVPLTDGAKVVGSTSNVLTLSTLQNTANYSAEAYVAGAGSTTSAVAVVTVSITPTPPFFVTQPYGATNSVGATITLTALANGTGPITYQWYFAPTNSGTYTALSGQTSSTLSLVNVNFTQSGTYYVIASGGAGSPVQSTTATVLVTPPPLVSISYLHSFLITNPPSGPTNLNNGTIYNVQGIVTTFGAIISKTYSEYFIQDGTGGALVFVNGTGSTNTPPAGALVSVIGPAQQYYGALELAPNVTTASNTVTILSINNPLPAPVLLNLPLMATNPMDVYGGVYGRTVQGSLVTLTNVYLYSSSSGGAVSGNFPTNSTKALYAFQKPYSAGQPYMEIYVYTYTNVLNQLNTNFWGKPIPSSANEVTGPMALFNPSSPEIYPTRFADIVNATNAPFKISIATPNGVPTVSWPTPTNNLTYSVYSTTNLLGPWTQNFGVGYYPSTNSYTDTNAAPAKFYRVSTP